MQISTGAMRAQLQKSDPFEAQADHRTLFGIPVTFVPEAAFSLQQVGVFGSEAIETGTAESIFTFNNKPQTYRQFAKGLLVSLNRRQSRQQIAFAVGRAPCIKFAVEDAAGKWTNGPVCELPHRLH